MVGETPKLLTVDGFVKFIHVCKSEDAESIRSNGLLLGKASHKSQLIRGIYAWDLSHEEALIKIESSGNALSRKGSACVCEGTYEGIYTKVLDGDNPLRSCIVITEEVVPVIKVTPFLEWLEENTEKLEEIKRSKWMGRKNAIYSMTRR